MAPNRPVEAAAPVDAQNAPTGAWTAPKTRGPTSSHKATITSITEMQHAWGSVE
jgi:hypothetical protein